jgi:hypothetical protein
VPFGLSSLRGWGRGTTCAGFWIKLSGFCCSAGSLPAAGIAGPAAHEPGAGAHKQKQIASTPALQLVGLVQ